MPCCGTSTGSRSPRWPRPWTTSPPVGKIYLPDCSYREMTEWVAADSAVARIRAASATRWSTIPAGRRCGGSCGGGFWRNFKVKYPEADEMYARMMMVSRRLARAIESGGQGELVEQARTELYRGQCNCGYWHGAFGGVYLPHLRNAVYQLLIAADNLLGSRRRQSRTTWIEAATADLQLRQPPGSATWPTTGWWRWSRPAAAVSSTSSTSAASATTCWPRSPAAPRPITTRCWPGPATSGQVCQHSRPHRLQAARAGAADPIRRPPPQEPAGLLLRQRRHAGKRGLRPGRSSKAISSTGSTKPASAAIPTASRCRWSATATPWATRSASPRA